MRLKLSLMLEASFLYRLQISRHKTAILRIILSITAGSSEAPPLLGFFFGYIRHLGFLKVGAHVGKYVAVGDYGENCQGRGRMLLSLYEMHSPAGSAA
jgi:hypothetical protein